MVYILNVNLKFGFKKKDYDWLPFCCWLILPCLCKRANLLQAQWVYLLNQIGDESFPDKLASLGIGLPEPDRRADVTRLTKVAEQVREKYHSDSEMPGR